MQPSYSNHLAQALSVLFHPLLMPFWAMCALVLHGNYSILGIPYHGRWLLAGLVFVATAALPAMFILLLYRMRILRGLNLRGRDERSAPILIGALFFYLSFLMLKQQGFAPMFGVYMLGASLLAIISLLINFWWKISLHMIAQGALTGAMIGLAMFFGPSFLLLAVGAVLLSGLIGWSRLQLKVHRQEEVYAGFMLGAVFMLLLFNLLIQPRL